MRAYIGYSRTAGQHEGAIAIWAHSARQAKRVGFPAFRWLFGESGYTDFAVRWLRTGADYHADREKLAAGVPHVNDSPEPCERCWLWFAAGLNENRLCDECAEIEAEEAAA